MLIGSALLYPVLGIACGLVSAAYSRLYLGAPGFVRRLPDAAGTTVLVITHDRELAAGLPRQISMRDGQVS